MTEVIYGYKGFAKNDNDELKTRWYTQEHLGDVVEHFSDYTFSTTESNINPRSVHVPLNDDSDAVFVVHDSIESLVKYTGVRYRTYPGVLYYKVKASGEISKKTDDGVFMAEVIEIVGEFDKNDYEQVDQKLEFYFS